MKRCTRWLASGSAAALWACATSAALAESRPVAPTEVPETAAVAQTPVGGGPAAGDPSGGVAVSEIVVTANKRAERILDVPGAITAFRGDDLLNSGTNSLRDLAGFTPGLQFNNGVGSGAPIVRGLSIGIDTSPTVATVVNGAPVGSSSSLSFGAQETLDLDPIDIDRLEVLKGPQGTLYGASTLGGLISYALREPSLTRPDAIFRSEVSGTKDGDPSYSIRGAVGAPLVADKVAVRASGFYDDRGGFVDNALRNIKDENSSSNWGAHGSVLFTPVDKLRITLDGFYQQLIVDSLDSVAYNFTTQRPRDGDLQYNEYVTPSTKKNTAVGILNIDYDLGFARFTSVTSRQKIDSVDVQNATSGSISSTLAVLPIFGGAAIPTPSGLQEGRDNRTEKTTQEFRLTSPENQRLTWIVGGFYNFETTNYAASVSGQSSTGALIPTLSPALRFFIASDLEEYSGFANATFKITPKLDVTGGFRVGEIHQTFQQAYSGSDAIALNTVLTLTKAPPVPALTPINRESDGVHTFLGTLRYHFSPDGMVFARYSTGFRPGGPNIVAPGLPATFQPDRTKNYETGVKSRFWGGRGSIDVTGYYEQWDDIIVVASTGGLAGYTNGGAARIYGVESAFTLRPIPQLTLSATYAYSDAEITRADPAATGILAKGDRLPYDPRSSGSVSAEYRAPLVGDWTGYASGALRYNGPRDSVFRSSAATLDYRLPSYTLLDLHAGVERGPYAVDLFIKNVTDERAQLAANPFFNLAEVIVQRPRTVGLAVTLRY